MTKQYTPPTRDIDETLKAQRRAFVGETFNDSQTKTQSVRLLYRREFKSTEGKEVPTAGVWCSDVLSDEEMIALDSIFAKLDASALTGPEFSDKT